MTTPLGSPNPFDQQENIRVYNSNVPKMSVTWAMTSEKAQDFTHLFDSRVSSANEEKSLNPNSYKVYLYKNITTELGYEILKHKTPGTFIVQLHTLDPSPTFYNLCPQDRGPHVRIIYVNKHGDTTHATIPRDNLYRQIEQSRDYLTHQIKPKEIDNIILFLTNTKHKSDVEVFSQ